MVYSSVVVNIPLFKRILINVIIDHVLQVLGTIPAFKNHTEDPKQLAIGKGRQIYLIVFNTYFWCTDIILSLIHFNLYNISCNRIFFFLYRTIACPDESLVLFLLKFPHNISESFLHSHILLISEKSAKRAEQMKSNLIYSVPMLIFMSLMCWEMEWFYILFKKQ